MQTDGHPTKGRTVLATDTRAQNTLQSRTAVGQSFRDARGATNQGSCTQSSRPSGAEALENQFYVRTKCGSHGTRLGKVPEDELPQPRAGWGTLAQAVTRTGQRRTELRLIDNTRAPRVQTGGDCTSGGGGREPASRGAERV